MPENNQTNSNGRGGRRQGAGRKAGSATKKTREIADKAMAEGISPLEFMLNIMRTEPEQPEDGEEFDYRLNQMRLEMRFEAAKAAAPYIHPRLAAVEHSGGVTIRTLAEELAELNAQRNTEDGSSVA